MEKEKNIACTFCRWFTVLSHVALCVNLLVRCSSKTVNSGTSNINAYRSAYDVLGALVSSWHHDLWTKYMELKRHLIPLHCFILQYLAYTTDNKSYSKINILIWVQNIFEGEHRCAKITSWLTWTFYWKWERKWSNEMSNWKQRKEGLHTDDSSMCVCVWGR